MHPLVNLKVPEGSIAVHWFEQSSFALKDSTDTIIQIDPYFPRNRPSDRFIHTDPPLDESELPTDFVLLTHAHGDHTMSRINTQNMGYFYCDTIYRTGGERSSNFVRNRC